MQRACLEDAGSELRSTRRSPLARGTIKAPSCDAMWPKDRAKSLGCVLPSALRELCRAFDGILIHRLWKRDHCAEQRGQMMPPRV